MAARTAKKKTAAKPRTPRAAKGSQGPAAAESLVGLDAPELAELVARIRKMGGAAVGAYRDPFAGSPLILASLPLQHVAETPFQRDLSRTHADRLAVAIGHAGAFLDPIIAIPGKDLFLSPNGRHRLAAAKKLGMKAITALVVPNVALAYRILVLNTEKAHNLRDRSLEVIRMARALAREAPKSTEKDQAVAFESSILLTLGAAYELNPRFAGSAYQSFLRRVDSFQTSALPAALRQREQWAQRLVEIDKKVAEHVAALQKLGFKSPYLRMLVVARCNPVRFVKVSRKKDAAPAMSMAEALTRMTANARSFKPASAKPADLALVAAVSSGGDET